MNHRSGSTRLILPRRRRLPRHGRSASGGLDCYGSGGRRRRRCVGVRTFTRVHMRPERSDGDYDAACPRPCNLRRHLHDAAGLAATARARAQRRPQQYILNILRLRTRATSRAHARQRAIARHSPPQPPSAVVETAAAVAAGPAYVAEASESAVTRSGITATATAATPCRCQSAIAAQARARTAARVGIRTPGSAAAP